MKYKRNLSNGMKKIFLLIALFAFLIFNPLSIFAVEEGSDHPSEIGTTDVLKKYTSSADKIVEVFDVQTTTVLPNLDKVNDVSVLVGKITEYNTFVNDFTGSIDENIDETSGLFTQMLGDYRFLRKAIYHIRKFNTLAQNLDTAYTLVNSTETYINDNEISDSDLMSSLADREDELDGLSTSMGDSINGIFTIIEEMKLEEYSTAIDLLEIEKENYTTFVVDYDVISDEIISNAEKAIDEVSASVSQLTEECESGGGKWIDGECVYEESSDHGL